MKLALTQAACQRAFLRSTRRLRYFGDAHPRLQIQSVAHGRGWVAVGDLAADEVVLIEKAFCGDDAASLAAAFANGDHRGRARALDLTYRVRTATGATEFHRASDLPEAGAGAPPPPAVLRGILGNNAYCGQLFPYVAVFNHGSARLCVEH